MWCFDRTFLSGFYPECASVQLPSQFLDAGRVYRIANTSGFDRSFALATPAARSAELGIVTEDISTTTTVDFNGRQVASLKPWKAYKLYYNGKDWEVFEV